MADDKYNDRMNNDLPPVDAYEDMQIPDDDMYQNMPDEAYMYEDTQANQSVNNDANIKEPPKQSSSVKNEEQDILLDDNLFLSEEMKQDAEELSELEKNNGINVDDNKATPELDPSIDEQSQELEGEATPDANFNLSERDYDSLDHFSSFRGDNLAISDGDTVNEYIKSEGLVDKIDSLQDMSQEDKDALKDLVYQESEPVSGQLGFPKNRLYEEIGDKNFGVNKNLNPDGSEIVHDKDNLSEDGKSKEAKNEEASPHDPYENPNPNQNHPSYVLQSMWNSYYHNRNLHNTNVKEKQVTPKSVKDMSLAEQTNHFDQMNRDMDYMKAQMERHEKNTEKHAEMKEDFELNKDSLSPEQSKIQQEKIKELNGNNNKQRVAIEKQMDDMSLKMDDISNNHDPMTKMKKASPHDKRTVDAMSKTMKETKKRTKELSDISSRLESKDLVSPKKSSGFNKSLKNIGEKIKDVTQSIANTISKVFSR